DLGTTDGPGPVVVRAVSVALAGVGVLAACHRSSPGRCGRRCVGAGCFFGVGLVQPSLGGRPDGAPDTPWWRRFPCTVARRRDSLSRTGPAPHRAVGGTWCGGMAGQQYTDHRDRSLPRRGRDRPTKDG